VPDTLIYTIAYHSQNWIRDGIPLNRARELLDILAISRARNAAAGITGVLISNEDRFVQILEGEQSAVEDTFNRIRSDGRHTAVTIFQTGTAPQRQFENWSMALAGTSALALRYYWLFTHQKDFSWDKLTYDTLIGHVKTMMDFDLLSQSSK
jgi:hypothetical protein